MRTSDSGVRDRGGGAGRAGGGQAGENKLGRKKAITEVQTMKTTYRRDGQMERDKEKPREIASESPR